MYFVYKKCQSFQPLFDLIHNMLNVSDIPINGYLKIVSTLNLVRDASHKSVLSTQGTKFVLKT